MRALLLAAGFGTRLQPITKHIPKCLVPINNKPLLEYWIELLDSDLIDRVLINTHYLSEKVEDYIKASPIASKTDLVFEEKLLGTAGTIIRNKDFFKNETFLVAHADNLTRFNLEDFHKSHKLRPEGVDITIMTFRTDNPQSCGIVEVLSNGIVYKFHEKIKDPPNDIANAAVYIFEPNVIDYLIENCKVFSDISNDLLPNFIGKMQIYHNSDYHRDIGTPESLMQACIDFK